MKNKSADKYLKVVEWSDEDNCYIGTSPGLFAGGVHGKNEGKVFKELCSVIDGVIKTMHETGMTLPKSTINRKFSGKIALRIPPDLHKTIFINAMQNGESVNKLIQYKLETSL